MNIHTANNEYSYANPTPRLFGRLQIISSDIPAENKDRFSNEPSAKKNNPPPPPCGQINAGQRRLSRVDDNM